MAEVTQSRYQQLLRRVFGIYATQRIADVIPPSISPSADVNDPYQPEMRSIRGERSFSMLYQATNTAAVNFSLGTLTNPVTNNRVLVVKRLTWHLNIPTAANQPGELYLGYVVTTLLTALSPAVQPAYKDGRVIQAFGIRDLSLAVSTQGVGTSGLTSAGLAYAITLFPGAATVPFIHINDQVDVVVTPGSELQLTVRASVLPVATYTWNVTIEGFSRTLDPNEQLPAVP